MSARHFGKGYLESSNRMTISLSNGLLESMGFRSLSEPESISARFHFLHVYKIQGIMLDDASLPPQEGVIADRSFRLAAGTSINAICRLLVNDDLVDNEQEWQTQRNCVPPYLVVHLGPSEEHVFAGTHGNVDGPAIQTYDGFRSARAELDVWGIEVLPSLLTGLVSSFSVHGQFVKIVPTASHFYGIASDGRTVCDIHFTGSSSGYGSVHLAAEKGSQQLVYAINLASKINPKVARFFHLAMHEDDPLKRFLYFFLAVEIQTHATYLAMGLPRMSLLAFPPERATASAQLLVDAKRENWINVRDRFVWCVLSAWHHLSDSDIEVFKRLKEVWDKIAHGSLSAPPGGAVVAVERLAIKLQHPGIGTEAINSECRAD